MGALGKKNGQIYTESFEEMAYYKYNAQLLDENPFEYYLR